MTDESDGHEAPQVTGTAAVAIRGETAQLAHGVDERTIDAFLEEMDSSWRGLGPAMVGGGLLGIPGALFVLSQGVWTGSHMLLALTTCLAPMFAIAALFRVRAGRRLKQLGLSKAMTMRLQASFFRHQVALSERKMLSVAERNADLRKALVADFLQKRRER